MWISCRYSANFSIILIKILNRVTLYSPFSSIIGKGKQLSGHTILFTLYFVSKQQCSPDVYSSGNSFDLSTPDILVTLYIGCCLIITFSVSILIVIFNPSSQALFFQ